MWLSELKLALPDQTLPLGSLRIQDGLIAEVVEGPAPAGSREPLLHCAGLIAIPGIIDLHGDMLEREIEPRPGARFPIDMALLELDKRLATAGVTTAYAALSFYDEQGKKRTRSTRDTCEMVRAINNLRDALLVETHVHARYDITQPGVSSLISDLMRERQVGLLSLMDHTPGQGQYRDIERYMTFIAQWRDTSRESVEQETRLRLAQARDQSAYLEVVRELAALALAHGIAIASHDDDTPEKVQLVLGLGCTISEFPVTLEAAEQARQRGMAVVMGAPNALRGYSHSGNLSALEAIQAGLVDILASDYAPAAILHAAFRLVAAGTLSLHEAARLTSQNAASALGLRDRGRIEPGLLADLVLVEQGQHPRVRATLRAGESIFWDKTMSPRLASRRLVQLV